MDMYENELLAFFVTVMAFAVAAGGFTLACYHSKQKNEKPPVQSEWIYLPQPGPTDPLTDGSF